MGDKYTSYDQMRNSYSTDGTQVGDALRAQSVDSNPETEECDQQVEHLTDHVDTPLPSPNPVDNKVIEDIATEQSTEKEEVILSLSQSLSSALRYQQILDEKLSGIIQWQEKQERDARNLATQLESLTKRIESLASGLSTIPDQRVTPQRTTIILDDIQKVLSRMEKSNLDAIRESKNFQQTLYAKQNKELDSYRSLHSNTANANILIEIAHFRNAAEDIVGRLDDLQARNLRVGVVEAIDELLEEYGVEIHQTPVGQRRSLRTCQTRKQVPTGDEALHGMVACSVAPSFSIGNLILLKEIVDTYVYDASLRLPTDEGEQESEAEGKPESFSPDGQISPERDKEILPEAPDTACDHDPEDKATPTNDIQPQGSVPVIGAEDENTQSDPL